MQNWKKMLVPTTARALVWTSTRTISFVGQTTARAAVCTRACADANNAVAKAELPWEGGKKDWVWNELRPTLHHVAAQPCVTVLMAAAFCAAWSTTTTHVPNHHAKTLPTCKKKTIELCDAWVGMGTVKVAAWQSAWRQVLLKLCQPTGHNAEVSLDFISICQVRVVFTNMLLALLFTIVVCCQHETDLCLHMFIFFTPIQIDFLIYPLFLVPMDAADIKP